MRSNLGRRNTGVLTFDPMPTSTISATPCASRSKPYPGPGWIRQMTSRMGRRELFRTTPIQMGSSIVSLIRLADSQEKSICSACCRSSCMVWRRMTSCWSRSWRRAIQPPTDATVTASQVGTSPQLMANTTERYNGQIISLAAIVRWPGRPLTQRCRASAPSPNHPSPSPRPSDGHRGSAPGTVHSGRDIPASCHWRTVRPSASRRLLCVAAVATVSWPPTVAGRCTTSVTRRPDRRAGREDLPASAARRTWRISSS